MNKKKIGAIIFIILVLIGIGGKLSMDKRAKDLAELHKIQTDLANYLYNNYRIYTRDKKKVEDIYQEFDKGKGTLTEKEYFNKLEKLKEYSDISKIEFTGFSVGPMKGLEVQFIINGVYPGETTLDTVSVETNKWIYSIDTGNTRNNYVLEEKNEPTTFSIPENNIIYYEGDVK